MHVKRHRSQLQQVTRSLSRRHLFQGFAGTELEEKKKRSMDGGGYGPQQQQHEADASTAQKTADLTAFVQNLLLQMQTRFQAMSESIVAKIDEMGLRIDDLERSVAELVRETGHGDAMPSSPPHSYQRLSAGSTKCSKMIIVVSGGRVDIPELVRELFIV